jgi:RNA polymerase-binding transcription factor DksA
MRKKHRDDSVDFRERLESRRRALNDDLQRRMVRIREFGADVTLAKEVDDGDPCDLDVRLLEISAATLRRVDMAIKRLDDGTYGQCARCQGAIGKARLLAVPFAVYCCRCESDREWASRRPRHIVGSLWESEREMSLASRDEL